MTVQGDEQQVPTVTPDLADQLARQFTAPATINWPRMHRILRTSWRGSSSSRGRRCWGAIRRRRIRSRGRTSGGDLFADREGKRQCGCECDLGGGERDRRRSHRRAAGGTDRGRRRCPCVDWPVRAYSGGIYTITRGGLDIWDPADQFHFLYQQVSGDLEVVARVASLTNTNSWAKAGVMVRESLTGGSRHAFALASAGNGYAFQRRSRNGWYELAHGR